MQAPPQATGTSGSTPPTLEPITTITVPNDVAGRASFGFVQIDETNQILYIRHPDGGVALWERAMWFAPDIALLTLPITLLVTLIALRRVVLRPRRPGRSYCARCNYDLTPAPITAAHPTPITLARCPECGVETAARPPIPGQLIIRRVGPILAIALILFIAACGVIITRVERAPPGLLSQSPWPAPFVGRFVPALRFIKTEPPWGRGGMLLAHSITTSELIATPISRENAIFQEPALAPDGGMIALSIFEPGTTGYRHYISRITAGIPGPAQPFDIPVMPLPSLTSNQLALFHITAPLADGSRWIYLHRSSSRHSNSLTLLRTDLLRVQLNADNSRGPIEAIATYAPPFQLTTGGGYSIPYHRWLVHESDHADPNAAALHIALFLDAAAPEATATTTRNALVVVFDPLTRDATGTRGETAAPAPPLREISVSYPGTSFYNPRLTHEGRVLEFEPYSSTVSMSVDLLTGASTETPRTGTGPFFRIDHLGWTLGNAHNIEDKSGGIIATFGGGSGGLWGRPFTLSSNGRFAAGYSHTTTGNGWWNHLGIGPWNKGEILIWDLSQVPGWVAKGPKG